MNTQPKIKLVDAIKILKTATTELTTKGKSETNPVLINQAVESIELSIQSIAMLGIKEDSSLTNAKIVLSKYKIARDKYEAKNIIKAKTNSDLTINKTSSETKIFDKLLKKDISIKIDKTDIKTLNKVIGERKNETIQATFNQAHKYFQDRLSKDDLKKALKQKKQELQQLNDKNGPKRKMELNEEINSLEEEKSITENSKDIETGVKALKKALKHYKAVLKIAKDPRDKCEAFIGIGKCYHARGNLVEAANYYKKARQISEGYFNHYIKTWNKQAGHWNVVVDINPTMPKVITMRKSSSLKNLSASEQPPTVSSQVKLPPLPPITEKMAFLKELKDYVNKYNKNFYGPWLMTTRIQSAEKLIDFLEHPSKRAQIDFKEKELTALSKGKLGDIVKLRIEKIASILPSSLLTKLRSEIVKDQARITNLKARANRK